MREENPTTDGATAYLHRKWVENIPWVGRFIPATCRWARRAVPSSLAPFLWVRRIRIILHVDNPENMLISTHSHTHTHTRMNPGNKAARY